MKLDNLQEQIQNMQQRLAQVQRRIDKLPSMPQQQEIMATALEELGNGLKELQITSHLETQERKQALELATRSAAEISQIFNMLPCFIWKFCPKTTQFIYASEIVTELSGISREAFFQNPQIWDDRIDSEPESQEALRIAGEAITKGEPYRIVYLFHTLDGESRWFEVTARPAKEDDLVYYYGSTTDITDRKLAEEALRKSGSVAGRTADLLRTVVTNAPIVLYALDSEGVFTLSEGKGLEAVGLKSGQVVGQSAFELYHHQPHILSHLQSVLGGKESTWLGNLGDAVYENRTTPLRDNKGQVIGLIGVATDITQRWRAELARQQAIEALHLSQKRFRLAVDHFPDTFVIYDAQRRFQFVNAHGVKQSGLPESALLGHTDDEVFPPEITNSYLPLLQQAVNTRTLQTAECTILMPTGGEQILEVTYVPLLDEQGEIYQILGIVHNITALKLLTEELKTQKDFLQTVLDTTPNLIWVKDTEDRIVLANQALADFFGITVEDLLGKTNYDLHTDPVYAAYCIAQDLEVITTLQQIFIPDETFPNTDGEVRWFQTIKKPLFSKDGQVRQVLGVSTDITQRKQADELQRQTEDRLRRLVEANLIGVIFADFSGNITEANDTFLEMVGYTREELRAGKVRWLNMTPPEYAEDDAKAREQIRLTGVCTPHEKEYIRKDGSRIPILTGSALLEGSDQDCVSFVLDLTWRKQAEAQIRESLREKEILLQEIHHRVKNNLQVVSSLLDLQSQQLQEPIMLEMFRESCNRVKSMALVHENLYKSKNCAKVNFNEYIEGLTRNLFQVYGVNTDHITLERELDDVALSIDTAIPCSLIINELVSNALKHAFTDQTKGTIYIALHCEDDEHYTLTIRDNGIGLPLNWDVDAVKSLGLQLVKILVNQLEGTLQVNCRNGTEFSLIFSELSSLKTHTH